jgi:Arc/MetJ family transcription regulator
MPDAIARARNMRTAVEIDEELLAKAGTLVGTMSGHPESMH